MTGLRTVVDRPPQQARTLHRNVAAWYAANARDLPWRESTATPWGVLVSEVMLQQTPVARVLPVWQEWMGVWPTPAALAAATAGDAVRAWGRLGYPRRALRLHAAATALVADHAGEVPDSFEALRELPGIGDYTAAAVAAFGFGHRHAVLDTNVRRVLARAVVGVEFPAPSITRVERTRAEALLPADPTAAAAWSVGVMELGALVCRAARPSCAECPLSRSCRWKALGHPAYDGPPRRAQAWTGTDRQCRGRLLEVLRRADGPVHRSVLDSAWTVGEQRERCLKSLIDDGLVVAIAPARYALP